MVASHIFHVAIWIFVVITLAQIGFLLAAMLHIRQVTYAVRPFRLLLTGTIIVRCTLVWLAWNALKLPDGELGEEYWLLLLGGLFTLAGCIDLMAIVRQHRYGRRAGDVHPFTPKRRDD